MSLEAPELRTMEQTSGLRSGLQDGWLPDKTPQPPVYQLIAIYCDNPVPQAELAQTRYPQTKRNDLMPTFITSEGQARRRSSWQSSERSGKWIRPARNFHGHARQSLRVEGGRVDRGLTLSRVGFALLQIDCSAVLPDSSITTSDTNAYTLTWLLNSPV